MVTGTYGAGKSSVVEEMASVLEGTGVSYAAIDLDWLWWFEASSLDGSGRRRVLMANLEAVIGNYLSLGVSRFLMAWAMRTEDDADALRTTVPFPLQVVRLSAPLEVVGARLASAVTSGRLEDLTAAEQWVQDGVGADIGEVEVANDRPIREVAGEILAWLGWLE